MLLPYSFVAALLSLSLSPSLRHFFAFFLTLSLSLSLSLTLSFYFFKTSVSTSLLLYLSLPLYDSLSPMSTTLILFLFSLILKHSGTIPPSLSRLNGTIINLYLKANRLRGIIPPQLGGLKSLTRLGLVRMYVH